MTQKIQTEHIHGLAIDLARRSFYAYCRLKMPRLYTKNHEYLKTICDQLQDFIENKTTQKKLIITAPPRHGKTATIILLCQWVLGNYPETGIIDVSYNETLSSRTAKGVRDGIAELKADPNRLVYSDYFPKVKIKRGDGAINFWAIENRHFSFLATSPGGTITGVGAQLLIIDDLIKNWYEANNERIMDEHYEFYLNTLKSRLEDDAKEIIIMTRWSKNDLVGKFMALEAGKFIHINFPAHLGEGKMLADDLLSHEEFLERSKNGDKRLIAANYQQQPVDLDDYLYSEFKTYIPELLPESGPVEAAIDTADEGADYLACIIYKIHKNTAYVIDVIYTQDRMERTEQLTALALHKAQATRAWVESNNGGRGFARNIERIMREDLKYSRCMVRWEHQSQNKVARILSNSSNVNNSIIFPVDWKERWPEFHRDVTKMGRTEKWIHDDAADVLTMVIEKSISGKKHHGGSVRGALGI